MAVKTGKACSNSCPEVQQDMATTFRLPTLHLASLPACLHLVSLFLPPSTLTPSLRPLGFPQLWISHCLLCNPYCWLPAIAFFCPEPQWFASVEASLGALSAMCGTETFLGVFLHLGNDLTLPVNFIHYAVCDTWSLAIMTTPRTTERKKERTWAVTPHCMAGVASLERTLSQDFLPVKPLSWLWYFEKRCHFYTSERKHLDLITFLLRFQAG